jgi:hypothetical protein
MKMPIQRILTPVLISAIVSMGCATSYTPQEPGRIYFLTSGKGDLVFGKDGKTYRTEWTSSDILEAVSGNPAAEEHARTFVSRQRTAGVMVILAGVGLIVGYTLLYAGITGDPDRIDRRTTAIAGVSTLLGSFASFIGGLTVGVTSEGHLYDAINIYNDDVSRRQTRLPAGESGSTQPVPFGRLLRPQLDVKPSKGER